MMKEGGREGEKTKGKKEEGGEEGGKNAPCGILGGRFSDLVKFGSIFLAWRPSTSDQYLIRISRRMSSLKERVDRLSLAC